MCELFAVSASQPVDVGPFLAQLMPRGGRIGPHSDGWGVAYYEGRAARIFKDAAPAAESQCLAMLTEFKLKSTAVIAHIRKANPARFGRSTANTHPFEREWNGRSWVFVHNGKLPALKQVGMRLNSRFQPMGDTDSELAFCYILDTIAQELGYDTEWTSQDLVASIQPTVEWLREYGEFNFILSDGEHLYVYADTHLHMLRRTVNMGSHHQMMTYIATAPLSQDAWIPFSPGSFHVYREGGLILENRVARNYHCFTENHDLVVNA